MCRVPASGNAELARPHRRYCARMNHSALNRLSVLLMLVPVVLVYLPAGLADLLRKVPQAVRRTADNVVFRNPIALITTPLIVMLYVVIAVLRHSPSVGALLWFAVWIWLLAPWASVAVSGSRLRVCNLSAREVSLQEVQLVHVPKASASLTLELVGGDHVSVSGFRPFGGASRRWIEFVAGSIETERSALPHRP